MKQRILVIRFSAMGDVAMVASVLREFHTQHPDCEIVMVSRTMFKAFFEDIPQVVFHPINTKGKHKGLIGLYKLFKELKKYNITAVADLHNNIRSRLLTAFFSLSGHTIQTLDKGREEKKKLTRNKNKISQPLKLTTERYADVFRQLDFSLSLSHTLKQAPHSIPGPYLPMFTKQEKRIGVAPFAQHRFKVFPVEKMGKVIHFLSQQGYQIFIFGGGQKEKSIADRWLPSSPNNIHNTIGKLTVSDELDLIANLDLMLSMDSAGMHMASLVGTRCLSVWGATHPNAGFLGYGQSLNDCIQVDHPNRPSSIYGNKPCLCDGKEAIDLVTVEMITKKIQEAFQ